ncbi:unnamed protein product, partial [Amoebophrya sp. A25]
CAFGPKKDFRWTKGRLWPKDRLWCWSKDRLWSEVHRSLVHVSLVQGLASFGGRSFFGCFSLDFSPQLAPLPPSGIFLASFLVVCHGAAT